MTSPNEPPTASLYHEAAAAVVTPANAAGIVAAAIASYLAIAITAPRSVGFPLAQLALAAVPLIAVGGAQRGGARAAITTVRRSLGLGSARLRWFAAAIAIGATAWYLNLRLVAALPIPEHQARALAELVAGPSLFTALAGFAVLPAACEEIVFRGVLARALGARFPLVAAVAASAIVFSAYHLSLVQAVPTLTLGAALALLAIRAGSALPSMAAHALNNAAAIVMSRGEFAPVAGWIDTHPSLALAGAAGASAAGIAIAWRGATPGRGGGGDDR